MIVSSSSKLSRDAESELTPAMVRGLFLIWQSELQRGQQFNQIREIDSRTSIARSFSRRAFGLPEDSAGYETGSDRADRKPHLPDPDRW